MIAPIGRGTRASFLTTITFSTQVLKFVCHVHDAMALQEVDVAATLQVVVEPLAGDAARRRMLVARSAP